MTEPKKTGLVKNELFAILLALYDYLAIGLSFAVALWIRNDCQISKITADDRGAFLLFIPFYALACTLIFHLFKLYKSLWQFASAKELVNIVCANLICLVLHVLGMRIFFHPLPISYYIMGISFQTFLTAGLRVSFRVLRVVKHRGDRDGGPRARVMIIGAGQAGTLILKDLLQAREISEKVCCFIDDDPNKRGRFIEGVPIAGDRSHIMSAVQKYKIEKIYLALPSATPAEKRDILNICNETGCEVKTLPGIYQLATGELSVSKMKPVALEDLLGRDPIKVNNEEVLAQHEGKVVIVTGGGGSIGSELCRQIASHHPKQLIIFDIYENTTYDLQQELKRKFPELNLVTLIGSVRDSRKLFHVFKQYRPDMVYHAAAHKHVPLMEDSPCEAIKNNVIGTYKIAFAAMVHGCKRFLLISTDKAVNPTNIMGASKRLCEMVIQFFDKMVKEGRTGEIPQLFTHVMDGEKLDDERLRMLADSKTEFVAVRFGNVLGSNGSVIPLFKKQIEMGGPVTVTHPDIIRYFMTIPEAVSLVLQAGTKAHGGEIFVLDMGEPVKIDMLARNLIRLSGHVPDEDIKIEYTGLRPGEKLFEEKLMAEEGLEKTDNNLIHIGKPIAFDEGVFIRELSSLMEEAYANKETTIREMVQKIVVTYHPAKA